MNTATRKAKGRKLQQYIVALILKYFPALSKDDVKSTAMGLNGADVQLSAKAKSLFPYSIECKNQERIKSIYKFYTQAERHCASEAVAFVKSNRQKALAIIDAEYLIKLQSKTIGDKHE